MLFVCYPKCTTCQKAQKWLEEAGFEVCGIYDDLNDAPAGETTERATFLARKKAAQ